MVLPTTWLEQEPGAPQPAYRKLQRLFFAVCLLLGPLLISLWLVLLASELLTLWMIGFGTVALFLLPFGFSGMTWRAMRRSPGLAAIGGFLSLTGFIGYGLIGMWQVELSYHSAQSSVKQRNRHQRVALDKDEKLSQRA